MATSITIADTDQSPTTWQAFEKMPAAEQPDERVQRWLLHPGSLTRLLQENLGDSLGLELLNQAWEHPMPNEARLLGIDTDLRCLVRHVRLTAQGHSRVLARVVIPKSAMSSAIEGLLARENEPLGPLLFADPNIQRKSLEIALLKRHDSVFETLQEPAWCRRSLLASGAQRLLIYEAFLPALFDQTHVGPRG